MGCGLNLQRFLNGKSRTILKVSRRTKLFLNTVKKNIFIPFGINIENTSKVVAKLSLCTALGGMVHLLFVEYGTYRTVPPELVVCSNV
jgi:hypothetical protein